LDGRDVQRLGDEDANRRGRVGWCVTGGRDSTDGAHEDEGDEERGEECSGSRHEWAYGTDRQKRRPSRDFVRVS
jgi:hypothetical protein